MNETTFAFLVYIAWMIVLILSIVFIRVQAHMTGQHKSASFKSDGSDLSAFATRLSRVHANCYEHFPIFGGMMLLLIALEKTDISNPLAYLFLTARLLQGIVHLISTSDNAIKLRLFFFIVQFVIVIYWIISLVNQLI